MAKKTTDTATLAKPRKARAATVKYFLAEIEGKVGRVLVVAHSQVAAINAIVKLTPATPMDLLQAGKNGLDVLDVTRPTEPAPASLAAVA